MSQSYGQKSFSCILKDYAQLLNWGVWELRLYELTNPSYAIPNDRFPAVHTRQ
jgi:hypothetical protein